MNPFAPIQQQIYTRARHGIFRQTEGFDTVARSEGLEASFIKKVLHPFCVYDAPAELAARGEKDNLAYPGAIHLFHAENGDTVLGRSIYQAADFTGLRSALFSHNYVIPSSRSEELVQNYRSYLHADFLDHYDIGQSGQIPELNQIPVDQASLGSDRVKPAQLLGELHIPEAMFKQLLAAVMTSVAGGRKVYIALDVPASYISEAAVPLLELLYAALPYAYRRKLGFLTYAKEPQSRKGIHISFVERGSLRHGDRSIEKDYTFDLASGRVTNMELDWTKQPYLDLVWSRIGSLDHLEDFHRFADIMLKDMGPEKPMSISSYHELSVLYRIEGGDEALYERHKIAALSGMLEYLRPAGALPVKERLSDLFLARFDREFDIVKSGKVPDLAVAECIKDYYRIDPKNNERKIVEYFIRAAVNAIKDKAAFAGLYALIENHPSLRKAYFDQVQKDDQLSALLLVPYIQGRLQAAEKPREVVSLVQEWDRLSPGMWDKFALSELARSGLTGKLKVQQDLVASVNEVLHMLGAHPGPAQEKGQYGEWEEQKRQLKMRQQGEADGAPGRQENDSWSMLSKPARGQVMDEFESKDATGQFGREGSGISAVLAETARRVLLIELDLNKLTKEELLSLDWLKSANPACGPQRLDGQLRSKLAKLQSLYAWFSEAEPDVHVFDGLKPAEMDEVQKAGRRWLRDEVNADRFDRLTLAYYRGGAEDCMDYAPLVDALRKYAGSPDIVYRFFHWSAGQPLYVRGSKLAPAYEAAILAYFRKYDRDAFKKRANRKEHFDKAGRALRPVYERAGQELASPLMRMFGRGGKPMLFSVFILLLLAAGTLGILQLTGAFDKKEPAAVVPPVVDKPDVTEPAPSVSIPDRAVYTEQVKDKSGKEVTRLVFLFRTSSECKSFNPGSVTVTTPGAKATSQNLKLSNLAHDCGTGDSEETGVSAAGSTDSGHSSGLESGNKKSAGAEEGSVSSENDRLAQSSVDGQDDNEAGLSVDGEGSSTQTGTQNAGVSSGESSSSSSIDPDVYPNKLTAALGKAYSIPEGSRISAAGLEFVRISKTAAGKEQ
ncbi:glycosyltransferase [Paenibacillus sp. YPG26]|uniref:GAP1-N2 domain-containing protein n=1 Tax=Paenibacillus sp. YPG26 TaxID=2878915 RepID=UPI00203DD4AA|nr:glycosyltransferase [Paenibacillus sp. YPG26]USB33634.1 glycosyltransferase [Paenibacillus sp. YPG26]